MSFEVSLLHHVVQLRRPWLDDLMVLASALGSAGFIWWVTALITAVFPARRAAAWRMLLGIFLAVVVNDHALKPLFDRERPFDMIADLTVIDAKPASPSFPSGHTAIAIVGAFAGSQMLPAARWLLWPLAIVVAVSRVYIGVHWPSDVIAGGIVGLACAAFALGRLSLADRKKGLLYSEVSPEAR